TKHRLFNLECKYFNLKRSISLNCAAGVLGQLRYVTLDWPQTLSFLAVALTGMFGGQLLAKRLSSPALQRGFAWAVIMLGLVLLAKNR
ncbi:MAG: hypothetical protein WCO68_07355, partial [Verrucomicrobiota bacterium]